MTKKYRFISGLPRSGSTLLTAILNQNPQFKASISDPLHAYCHSIIRDTESSVGVGSLVPIEKRKQLMRALFDSFYADGPDVCFNTNRGWCADTELLHNLYPDFRMIVLVRDVPHILNSFEHLHLKNPLTIKPLYHHRDTANVYERCAILAGETDLAGYVKGPLVNLASSFVSRHKDNMLYITYGTLVNYPADVMRIVYEFLGEPFYQHDFNNVESSYDEFDDAAKIDGLHTTRRKVEYKKQPRVIPDDLWQQYKQLNVWEAIDKSTLNWIQGN